MGGGMNLGQLAKMAQQVQAQMAQVQDELREATVEATAGGGAVRVVVTGALEVRSIELAPDSVDPTEIGMLEDLVLTAVNDALARARRMAAARMAAVTGGHGLPGALPGACADS